MALSANTQLHHVRGEQSEFPQDAVTIYEGALLGDNSGYARGLVAGDPFLGHASEYYDNSGGSQGDHNIQRYRGRYRLQVTLSGVAVTDVGKDVYASADDTLTLNKAINTRVGVVDRYVTTDTAIVEFQTSEGPETIQEISARSRAATALPTSDIWQQFNLAAMREDALCGSLLDCDFTHGESEPSEQFGDASSVIRVIPGAAGEGVLSLFATADDEAAEVQWPSCPIVSSGGQPWAFEARVKSSLISDSKSGWFIGLMAGDNALAGDLIVDAGTLADVGAIGFQNKEGDGDILDFVYDKAGQTQNEHDDDYVTLEADTYVVVGMYYDGATIQGYVDGVATGTAISAVDIAAADFPAADVLVPTFCVKNAHADDAIKSLDWIRVAQMRA